MNPTLTLLAAFILGTIGVARATRLLTADAYPPAEHLRIWWEVRQINRDAAAQAKPGTLAAVRTGWGPLLTCPFCAAPYLAAGSLVWAVWSEAYAGHDGLLTSWAGWWWLVNIWATVSYLASMIVVRDEPPEED